MESETIQYIQKALQDRLVALGFTELSERTVSHEGKAFTEYGITIEQAERFIWKEHQELFPFIRNNGKIGGKFTWTVFESRGNFICTTDDPFTARLAGVERVIEILEERQKTTN